MAISQRLVDPYREIRVPTSYCWQESYQAALLETDWTKMQERVQTAESEIHQRRLVLSQDHGGSDEERAALVNAMSGLRVLRMNVASWLERQNLARIIREGIARPVIWCEVGCESRWLGLVEQRSQGIEEFQDRDVQVAGWRDRGAVTVV